MPLGGAEQTAGYKGYGLAAMVEVLCGVLGGGPYAHHIRSWTNPKGEANLVRGVIQCVQCMDLCTVVWGC